MNDAISPVILGSALFPEAGAAGGLGLGEMGKFPGFRHEYDYPYLLDEIRIGPVDTMLEWKIFHGGISICGEWVSPYAMTRLLNGWERLFIQNIDQATGGGALGVGFRAWLQWKLAYPMLVMPNEQITIEVRRDAAPYYFDIDQGRVGPVRRYNPYCVLLGRSLLRGFQAPPRKVVPYVTGFRKSFVLTDELPQIFTYRNADNELMNTTPQDIKLDRFGALTAFDFPENPNFGPGIIRIPAQPYPLPGTMTISDSEGGYIIRDPASLQTLSNGTTRIWDVDGALKQHQFWTSETTINMSPYALNAALLGSQFSLLTALVGYREIDNTQPLALTGDFYQRQEP